jgi:hypothetical protein
MSVRLSTNTVSKIVSLPNSTNAALITEFYKRVKNTAASEIQHIFNSIIQYLSERELLGLYLPSNIEFPTTFTELIAIARPAGIGSHLNIPTSQIIPNLQLVPIIIDVIDTNYILVLLSSFETSSM